MSHDLLQRVRDLQSYIAEGRILEAMHEFYDESVEMQEGLAEPVRGLAANLEREQQFLDAVAEWKGFEVHAVAVDGDRSLVEATMDFVDRDGEAVHYEQVSRAVWKDGKIVHERFYSA